MFRDELIVLSTINSVHTVSNLRDKCYKICRLEIVIVEPGFCFSSLIVNLSFPQEHMYID